MRKVLHSIRYGPLPARACPAARCAALCTAKTSLPSTISAGIPYPGARSTTLAQAICLLTAVAYAGGSSGGVGGRGSETEPGRGVRGGGRRPARRSAPPPVEWLPARAPRKLRPGSCPAGTACARYGPPPPAWWPYNAETRAPARDFGRCLYGTG